MTRFARGAAAPEPIGAPGDGPAGPHGEPERGRGRANPGQLGALVRLLVIVGSGVTAAVLTGTMGTVAVVLAIVGMIMLHELGHFATAKWAGMKVTEYFLGFGPRLWSVRRGETEYGVKAIPAGGYVRIIGMTNLDEVDPADEPRTYRQQSFWRRMSVAVAGSTMHFILALLLFWALLAFVGQPDNSKAVVGGFTTFTSGVSPARQAGIHPGDIIVSVDGKPVQSFDQLASTIQRSAGRTLEMVLERGGRYLTVYVTPVNARTDPIKGSGATSGPPVGMIGVSSGQPPLVSVGPLSAIGGAFTGIGQYSWQTLSALGNLVSPHGIQAYTSEVTGHASSQPQAGTPRFESPVGIVRLASQAAHASIADVLRLLILINVFVGLFNMLPMLPLDGGHVAIAIYERVRSRRGRAYHVDAAKLLPATYLVFIALVFLGVTALWLDVTHPLANPFQ